MKILILGASGMAGHVAAIYLKERGHKVIGFARRRMDYCETFEGNALNINHIKEAINSEKFDAVINCIGILNNDVEKNTPEGIFLNSYLPHYIAEYLKGKSTKLIHISTDCVFDGKKGNYFENDFRDSDTMYGRSKALGEINDSKNLTIRTSIIGPDIKKEGIGLLNWFLLQNSAIKGFKSAVWTGVSTITLAEAFEKAIEQNLTGLYHLVNNDKINKFDLLNLFNEYIKKDKIEIIEDYKYSVDKSLINNRRDFNFIVPSYEEMIKQTQKWIYHHKELYPHYF